MRSLSRLLFACLNTLAAAQPPEVLAPDPAASNLVDLNRSDGTLRAYGARYEAVFDASGVDFQPSLGVETERPVALHMALESVRRERGEIRAAHFVAPTVDGFQVRYDRRTYDEVYDAHAEGIEQSFVFRSLPDGAGDLVVRLKLTTTLHVREAEGVSPSGLVFQRDGELDAVKVGAVTGIDANGVRCSGALRCADDGATLELVLPARFVDAASLPLVLDPWITPAFDGSGGGGNFAERNADVAYDSVSDTFLIVWQREIAGVFQIRGRMVRCDGTVTRSFLGINTSTTSKLDPAVAAVHLQRSFVVSWTENLNIRATAVLDDGTIYTSAGIDVSANTDFEAHSDVGGQEQLSSSDAIVVWSNLTRRRIEAQRVRLSSTSMTIQREGARTDISTRSGSTAPHADSAPAISKCGHESGVHLIAWTRAGANAEICGQLVLANLNVVDAFVAISNNLREDSSVDCDGDGARWIATWEQREASGATSDVRAASVELIYPNVTRVGAEVAVEADPGDHEHAPTVAWVDDAALIGYLDESGGIDDAFVVMVDPFSGVPIAGREVVESTARPQGELTIAARLPRPNANRALVVWTEDLTAVSSTIRARCYDSESGIRRLGGACGGSSTGTAYAGGANVGYAGCSLRLSGAPASARVTLVVSPGRVDASCGACTLIPDPFRGFLIPATVDPDGFAVVVVPVPNDPFLRGTRVYAQWIVPVATPSCSVLNSTFSHALQIEIQ